MIGLLTAFALLRWRLFVNMLRGRRRDGFEQVSRVSRLLVAALIAVTIVPASVLLTIFAFVGGQGLAQGNTKSDAILAGARAVLALVTILVGVSPILRFGGMPSSSTRLALLPVPRGLLHAAELLAQLADPWVLAIVPALLALPAGFLAGGAPGTALWTLVLGLMMVAFLAALGSTSSLLAALVLRNRRIGELATVGLLVLVSAAALLPTAFLRESRNASKISILEMGRAANVGFESLPWNLYARAVEGPAAAPAVLLVCFTLALYGVSRWSFGRLLDAPPERGSRGSRGATLRSIPGLSSAAAAIAWTTLRLLVRSLRGRVILFTAPLPVLMLAILWKRSLEGGPWTAYVGVLVFGVGTSLTLFSLQTLLSNQFAVDRAGLTLTFLGPASGRDIVIGKAVGGALAFASLLGVFLVIAVSLHPRGSGALWLAAVILACSAYLAQAPVAAFVSALFPAPCDLMKLRAGNVHPLAGMLGMLASVVASLAGAAIFAATYALTGSAAIVLAAACVALAMAAMTAAVGLPLAAAALDLRRENLAMIAQGR